MEGFSGWESVLLGALVLLVIFWMGPGIKGALAHSRTAPSDWGGVLVPLGFVVALVIFLIVMV
jgi:hypothetical protein